MLDKKVKFRFLSGNFIGSNLSLVEGEYLIGNTNDCDITLHEENLETTEVKLVIDAELNVTLSPKQGHALVNQESLTTALNFKDGDVLVIGLTSLIKLAGDEIYSQEQILDLLKPRATAATTEVEANNEQAVSEPKSETKPAVEAEPQPPVSEQDQEAIEQRGQRIRRRVLMLITGLLLLLALFSLVMGSSLFGHKAKLREDLHSLQQYLQADQRFSKVEAFAKNGILHVDGIILKPEHLDDLIKHLPKLSYALAVNVTTADNRLAQIKRAFALRSSLVEPKIEDQSIHIYGYMKDKFVEGKIYEQVGQDLDTHNLHTAAKYQEDLEPVVNDLLSKYDLNLKLLYDKSSIIYDGRLTLNDQRNFKQLQQEVAQIVGSKVNFISAEKAKSLGIELLDLDSLSLSKLEVKKTKPATDKEEQNSIGGPVVKVLGFAAEDILAVTTDPMRFVSLKDGSRLFEGAVLPSGYLLKNITLEILILEKNGEQVEYQLK